MSSSKNKTSKTSEEIKRHLTQTALNFLGYRDRFKKEIEVRLKKEISKRFSNQALKSVPSILGKLEKNNLINDQELIRTYIKHQHKAKLRGPLYIKQKLIKMGAPRSQVDKIISRLITQQSQGIAIDRLIKKHKLNQDNPKDVAKFQRFLVYRGFSFSIIKEKIAFISQKE